MVTEVIYFVSRHGDIVFSLLFYETWTKSTIHELKKMSLYCRISVTDAQLCPSP